MAKPYKCQGDYKPAEKIDPTDGANKFVENIFKYRITVTKCGILRYFSHLDWQNTFLKAVARTDLSVAYSQGFNPTMKISMGVALPLFAQSEGELVDIELLRDYPVEMIKKKLEEVLPKDCRVKKIVQIPRNSKSIDNSAEWAEYKVKIFNKTLYDFEKLKYNTDRVLTSQEIFIEKKNKKGLIKKINIKPSIKSYRFDGECLFIVLKTGQGTEVPALRADVLMSVIEPNVIFDITRVKFFDRELREL